MPLALARRDTLLTLSTWPTFHSRFSDVATIWNGDQHRLLFSKRKQFSAEPTTWS